MGNQKADSSPDHLAAVLQGARHPPLHQTWGRLDPHLFREPPKSRQAMAFFMSVPPKMEGAMLLETTS